MLYSNDDIYDVAVEGALDRYGGLGWDHPVLQSIIFNAYNSLYLMDKNAAKPEVKEKTGPKFLIIHNESKTFKTAQLDCKLIPCVKYFIPVEADHIESIMTDGTLRDFEFRKKMDDRSDHWFSFIGSNMVEDIGVISDRAIFVGDVYGMNLTFSECGKNCDACKKSVEMSERFKRMFNE